MEISVREAEPGDVHSIALLCSQLGYAADESTVASVVEAAAADREGAILVACDAHNLVIAWTQLVKQRLLTKDMLGTITAFVVDESCRGAGVGSKLLTASESWFSHQGCTSVLVRSNTVRRPAHQFYLKNGYEHFKTSENFRKKL